LGGRKIEIARGGCWKFEISNKKKKRRGEEGLRLRRFVLPKSKDQTV
jgi:hypothetical protein